MASKVSFHCYGLMAVLGKRSLAVQGAISGRGVGDETIKIPNIHSPALGGWPDAVWSNRQSSRYLHPLLQSNKKIPDVSLEDGAVFSGQLAELLAKILEVLTKADVQLLD